MKANELKETDYLKAWALLTICAMVGGFVVGAVVGAICGGVLGGLGVPIRAIKVVCGILGFLAGLPISYLFFRIFVSRFIVSKLIAQQPSESFKIAA
jgi:multisubunit Na+/H+ antiporter MnhE subunit